jgi:hypothetical protein
MTEAHLSMEEKAKLLRTLAQRIVSHVKRLQQNYVVIEPRLIQSIADIRGSDVMVFICGGEYVVHLIDERHVVKFSAAELMAEISGVITKSIWEQNDADAAAGK